MTDKKNQNLAKKIAKLLNNERVAGLDTINERLDRIERALDSMDSIPEVQNRKSFHPSQQKFDVIEAVADEIIEHFENEKACTFEPNGKPCDHCSMCSSRGF
ncbi:MAG: hypothetical protein HKN25_05280 [Pyrinomonadaceae bacterium]|nr:hypothetical protein [Pyrinomonadaceae bacterium]